MPCSSLRRSDITEDHPDSADTSGKAKLVVGGDGVDRAMVASGTRLTLTERTSEGRRCSQNAGGAVLGSDITVGYRISII